MTPAEFYSKHKEHVDRLVKAAKRSYPPTDPIDKRNPTLWKGEHWKHYLENINTEAANQ
jgi:hypothetical protein